MLKNLKINVAVVVLAALIPSLSFASACDNSKIQIKNATNQALVVTQLTPNGHSKITAPQNTINPHSMLEVTVKSGTLSMGDAQGIIGIAVEQESDKHIYLNYYFYREFNLGIDQRCYAFYYQTAMNDGLIYVVDGVNNNPATLSYTIYAPRD